MMRCLAIKKILSDQGGVYSDVGFSEIGDKVFGNVIIVSNCFEGLEQAARQKFIWDELEKKFSLSVLLAIPSILTLTPQEANDIKNFMQ